MEAIDRKLTESFCEATSDVIDK